MALGVVAKVRNQIVKPLVFDTGTGLGREGTQCALGPIRPIIILRIGLMDAGLLVEFERRLAVGVEMNETAALTAMP